MFGLCNLGLNNMVASNLPGSSSVSFILDLADLLTITGWQILEKKKLLPPGLMGHSIFLFD